MLQLAYKECLDKHKGANAAMYGDLGYILLTVVAADKFGVYAMALDADSAVSLVEPFKVGTNNRQPTCIAGAQPPTDDAARGTSDELDSVSACIFHLKHLYEEQVRDLPGRRRALQTFINITRWVRSVYSLRLLPPPPLLHLLEWETRPSPFGESKGRCVRGRQQRCNSSCVIV